MNKPSRILVIFNRVTKAPSSEEKELLADEDNILMANSVANALTAVGYTVELFEVNQSTLTDIPQKNFDLIFNLTEGLGDLPKSDFLVARFLEKHHLPFTGSGSYALALTNNKVNTKNLLLRHHLRTPKFVFLTSPTDPLPSWLTYPVIIKPVGMEASVGLSQISVVETNDQLKSTLASQEEKYGDLFFVEEYIYGREINVALLGNGASVEVLPPSEILFDEAKYPGKYKIVDFDAKWVEESPSYQATLNYRCPAPLEKEVEREIYSLARQAFLLTGCTDYSRIDFRLSPDGTPFVLEVNGNQGLSPDTGTVRSAKAAGYTYESFIEKIVDHAVKRLSEN